MMYRTTFSPSPRVAKAIRDHAKREGKSISRVINEMLEAYLSRSEPAQKAAGQLHVFELNLRPGYDPTKFNEYADEVDDEGQR
jgi:hypothetical protein